MNPGEERDITTTPTESRPDGPNRAPSGTRNTVETGTDSGPAQPAGETARDKNGTGEVGGRAGPDPARYGDWEKNGRCIDF